jgi:hypothetical protein
MTGTPNSTGTPDFIGKFRIDGILGRGAMGMVYKAHDPDIDRTVALKLVRNDLLSGEARGQYIARFQSEAKIVGRCMHPNIVGIYDFAMRGDDPFLVLEYVDGQHLGRLLNGTQAPDLACVERTLLAVLEALDYAHGFGIIHRDIKPANILVARDAVTKVADFGISRAFAVDLTMSSVLVGTPCYMSPEQCLGEPVDARSDLFSVGCVLYEMLAGQRAFPGENYVATIQNVLHGAPAALAGLRPDLQAGVLRLVDKALAKTPRDRYRDAREMAESVRSAFAGAGEAPAEAATVVAAMPAQAPKLETLAVVEQSTLSSIERRLASFVGPMARHHLRRAFVQAETPEELSKALAELVDAGPERDRLASEVLRIFASNPGLAAAKHGPGPDEPDQALQTAGGLCVKTLAQVVGPIASILVRRALLKATTPAELEAEVLRLMDAQDQKAQFQALLSRGKAALPKETQA